MTTYRLVASYSAKRLEESHTAFLNRITEPELNSLIDWAAQKTGWHNPQQNPPPNRN